MQVRPLSADEQALINATSILDSHCRQMAIELYNLANLLENSLLAADQVSPEVRKQAMQAIKNARR